MKTSPGGTKDAEIRAKALAALAELYGLHQSVSYTLPTLEQIELRLPAVRCSNERGTRHY